jgi:hypothetical protein
VDRLRSELQPGHLPDQTQVRQPLRAALRDRRRDALMAQRRRANRAALRGRARRTVSRVRARRRALRP